MEDFGYQKNSDGLQIPGMMQKVLLAGAALLSLALFIYITVNSYYFVYYGDGGEVETVKSPEGPIKEIVESGKVVNSGKNNMHTIYQDIFGNADDVKKDKVRVRKAPEPAVPTQPQADSVKKVDSSSHPQDSEITKIKRDSVALPNVEQSKGRVIRVQIAAMTSQDSAQSYWRKISDKHPEVFDGLRPFVEEVDLGKRGIFFRLQIGNFFNQPDAENFCSRYISQTKKTRADCIVVE